MRLKAVPGNHSKITTTRHTTGMTRRVTMPVHATYTYSNKIITLYSTIQHSKTHKMTLEQAKQHYNDRLKSVHRTVMNSTQTSKVQTRFAKQCTQHPDATSRHTVYTQYFTLLQLLECIKTWYKHDTDIAASAKVKVTST